MGKTVTVEYRTCRFCQNQVPAADLVKYAVRAYAHPVCLFKERGEEALAALYSHQIRSLPVFLLQRAGLGKDSVAAANKIQAWLDDANRREGRAIVPGALPEDERTGPSAIELRLAAEAWANNLHLPVKDDIDSHGLAAWMRLKLAAVNYTNATGQGKS